MKTLIACTLAIAVTGASAAVAQQGVLAPGDDVFVEYGKVGGWTIYGDQDRGTCLIEGVDDNGNVVQMGLTDQAGVGYLGVFTRQDVRIKDGALRDVTIVVNDHIYRGTAQEMKRNVSDGYQGGYVLVDNPDFLRDLQEGLFLTAWPEANDGGGVVVDLKGSHKAITEAIACNDKMAAAR